MMTKEQINNVLKTYQNLRDEVQQSNLSDRAKQMLDNELRTAATLVECRYILAGGSLK